MSHVKVVLLSGGGTGGHITPILAVAHEIKLQSPETRVVYVGERGGAFGELTASHEAIDAVHTVWAGKYRRYHGESWLTRVLDIKTNLLNFRDLFYFLIGTVQAWFLLGKVRPETVFLKGGFVGVPVGLAAASRRIRFVTHDSDALPGLANRLVGRWAAAHAVALPADTYAYPSANTVQVGVLVEPSFQLVSAQDQALFKAQIGVPETAPLLLVTGGSSGAVRLNEAMTKIVDRLLADFPELRIIHQAGKGKAGVYGAYQHQRLSVLEFMRPMSAYTGAADVVVTRASANTVAELGVQRKALIVVASPFLANGHQLKNAELLVGQGAALSVNETAEGTDAVALEEAVRSLLNNQAIRDKLADQLHGLTKVDAAQKLATILLKQ